MILEELWQFLNQAVFPFESTERLWNPYAGLHPEYDTPGADQQRRQNLHNYLASFPRAPKVMLVGEAPGPWGCRFSGLPFTGERMFLEGDLPFTGIPTSTFDPPAIERSGTILWGSLRQYHPDFLLWNCIPYHPYNPGEPLSIRTPLTSEIKEFSPILKEIVVRVMPQYVVAIGRKAETALSGIGIEAQYVRHPSFGGASAFRAAMQDLFAGGN